MIVCLFDIDGTLIASGGAGKAALEAALADEFGVTHLIEKLQLSGRTDRAIVRDLFRMHVIDETPANLRRLTAAYLRRLPECPRRRGPRGAGRGAARAQRRRRPAAHLGGRRHAAGRALRPRHRRPRRRRLHGLARPRGAGGLPAGRAARGLVGPVSPSWPVVLL